MRGEQRELFKRRWRFVLVFAVRGAGAEDVRGDAKVRVRRRQDGRDVRTRIRRERTKVFHGHRKGFNREVFEKFERKRYEVGERGDEESEEGFEY